MLLRKNANWFDHCPICKNSEINPEDRFCKVCGLLTYKRLQMQCMY